MVVGGLDLGVLISADVCQTSPNIRTELFELILDRHNPSPRYGLCPQYTRLKTAERYDQLTGVWQSIAQMHTARSGLGLVALGGKIYAIGGFDGTNCLRYHGGLSIIPKLFGVDSCLYPGFP